MHSAGASVEIREICKAFGATVALENASFSVEPGTVHALLGENGAGKSTIVKMMSGLLRPDAGQILIAGRREQIRDPRTAHRLGIQTAFQEMTQIKDLTVVQNMLLPYQPINGLGLVKSGDAYATVARHLESLGLGSIDPSAEVGALDLPVRQKIEIARAILRLPRVLLLDEPTASLSGKDIHWLGDLIAKLKTQGCTILFISHRMIEVRMFCDTLTVLRNGKNIGSGATHSFSDDEVVRLIIGRSLAATFPPRPAPAATPSAPRPALSGHNLHTERRLRCASFSLGKGELLGVAGLQGMGQLELFLSCFGAMPLKQGQIAVDGKPVLLNSPRDAVRENIGLGYVPEDRKTEGLLLTQSGRHNMSLPIIDRFSRFGIINRRRESSAVRRVLQQVQAEPRALYTRVGAFSGGNQQKIAIGKWLLAGSRTLLMYDPTRGVDVGTKHELYGLMRKFVADGGAILFYSTEIAELVNLCDRVLVIYGGAIVSELSEVELSEEAIIRSTLGERTSAPAPVH
jgi:ribose transport system ATP-binding protein